MNLPSNFHTTSAVTKYILKYMYFLIGVVSAKPIFSILLNFIRGLSRMDLVVMSCDHVLYYSCPL